MKKILLSIYITLFFCNHTFGQDIDKFRFISGVITNMNSNPIDGVVIKATNKKDTIIAISDNKGKFKTSKIDLGNYNVSISYIGYKTENRTIGNGTTPVDLKKIMLRVDTMYIDNINIKAKKKLMTIQGDTITYNTELIETLIGDETIDLLQRLPGVKIFGNSVEIMGKVVSRVYIDGQMVFGINPMDAFNNLYAADVKKIKVYDEMTDLARIQKDSLAEKKRVVNIRTKNGLLSSLVVRSEGTYGYDTQKNIEDNYQSRDGLKLNATSFKVGRKVAASFESTNVPDKTNNVGYLRENNARIGYAITPKNDTETAYSFDFNYNYNNKRSSNTHTSSYQYFPTNDYQSRTSDNNSHSSMNSDLHRFNSLLLIITKNLNITASPDVISTNNNTKNQYHNLSTLNGTIINNLTGNDFKGGNGYNITIPLNISYFWKEKHTLSLNSHTIISKDVSDGWKIDSLSSLNTVTELINENNQKQRQFNNQLKYTYRINSKFNVNAAYDYDYNNSNSYRMSINNRTAEIDSTLSYQYHNNNLSQKAGVMFKGQIKKLRFDARLNYQYTEVLRDEKLITSSHFNNQFDGILPFVQISYGDLLNPILLSYEKTLSIPSIDMLRPNLDNSNPLSLRAGNPNLRAPVNHNIKLSLIDNRPILMPSKTQSVLQINASLTITENTIVTRTTFFSADTPLSDHNNIIAPTGSTLVDYCNADNSMNCNIGVHYEFFITSLKLKVTLDPSFQYAKTPSYIDNKLLSSKISTPAFGLALNWAMGNKFKVGCNLASTVAYNHFKNSDNSTDNSINNTTEFKGTLNFAKYGVSNILYTYRMYYNKDKKSVNINSHILNASVGMKVLKNRSLTILLTANDIFNDKINLGTSVSENYLSTNYSQISGRCILLQLKYVLKMNKAANKQSK